MKPIVIKTPERKRKTRVCHLNMLKLYHVRDSSGSVSVPPVATVGVAVPSSCWGKIGPRPMTARTLFGPDQKLKQSALRME